MGKVRAFLKRKDIEISAKRYGIDALSAMAQGLFCSLLIGTIINTVGTQFHIGFLTKAVATIGGTEYTVGGLASAMSGPAMAAAIGYALHCPPMVLFSLIPVGFASNALGGAGGPLAVLFVAILAAELGKAVSKETKIDILVTPLVTIGVGVALSAWSGPGPGGGGDEGRRPRHVGDGAAAVPDGRPRLRHCRRGADAADLLGGHLRMPWGWRAWPAARRLPGCCAQMVGFAVMSLPGEPLGRPRLPGARDVACCRWATSSKTPASGLRRR